MPWWGWLIAVVAFLFGVFVGLGCRIDKPDYDLMKEP